MNGGGNKALPASPSPLPQGTAFDRESASPATADPSANADCGETKPKIPFRQRVKQRGGRRTRRVDLARAGQLLDQGLSLRETARTMGLGYGTLHRAVHTPGHQPYLIENPEGEIS